jgi:hypothetical protein
MSNQAIFNTNETLTEVISRVDFMQDIVEQFDEVHGKDFVMFIEWNKNPNLIKFTVKQTDT